MLSMTQPLVSGVDALGLKPRLGLVVGGAAAGVGGDGRHLCERCRISTITFREVII